MVCRAETESAVQSISTRQFGLITHPQLIGAGLTGTMVKNRQESRRLLPAGRAVYAVGRRAEGRLAAGMAATMVAGGGAVLSGRAAADVWGIHRHRGNYEVKRRNSRRAGEFVLDSRGVAEARPVLVRRSRNFSPAQVTRKHGIPILRPTWVLLDLAGELSDDRFGHAFKEADRMGLLNEQELRACLELGRGIKGIRRFQDLVARRHPDLKDARTLLEALFLELCAKYGIETPAVNHPKGRYFPDFRWDDIGLIVEVDGYEGHAGRLAFLDDASRENDLRRMGYQVLRFTWEEVTEHPELVARLVIQEIARCRALTQTER
jgi:hypothetical protein